MDKEGIGIELEEALIRMAKGETLYTCNGLIEFFFEDNSFFYRRVHAIGKKLPFKPINFANTIFYTEEQAFTTKWYDTIDKPVLCYVDENLSMKFIKDTAVDEIFKTIVFEDLEGVYWGAAVPVDPRGIQVEEGKIVAVSRGET